MPRLLSELSQWPVVRRAVSFLRRDKNSRLVEAALDGRIANLDEVGAFLRAQAVPMKSPLILISQAHRSGGTLLSQLFDGHPALAAHPHELKTGYPTDEDWSPVEVALGADKNFRMLFESKVIAWIRDGYTKGKRDGERRALFMIPKLQYVIFQELFQKYPPRSPRDIFNCYFAAYFGGWLNYDGDLAGKRWITAFAPRLAQHEKSVEKFFACYPDGKLIQIVREPLTWYPSAKLHRSSVRASLNARQIVDQWVASAFSLLRNKSRYGDSVIVLRFDDLVRRTEATMRWLAQVLEIDFDPILLQPTFNGKIMSANSSFAVEQPGLISSPLARESTLSEEERGLIEDRCRGLYKDAVVRAVDLNSSRSDLQQRAAL